MMKQRRKSLPREERAVTPSLSTVIEGKVAEQNIISPYQQIPVVASVQTAVPKFDRHRRRKSEPFIATQFMASTIGQSGSRPSTAVPRQATTFSITQEGIRPSTAASKPSVAEGIQKKSQPLTAISKRQSLPPLLSSTPAFYAGASKLSHGRSRRKSEPVVSLSAALMIEVDKARFSPLGVERPSAQLDPCVEMDEEIYEAILHSIKSCDVFQLSLLLAQENVVRIVGEKIFLPGIGTLAQALQSPRCGVTELYLRYNGIDAMGADLLGRALFSCKLQVFDCSFNPIGDTGIAHLAIMLFQANKLTNLSLCGAQISATGMSTLCQSFQLPHCMVKLLNLDSNKIGNDGAILLGQSLQSPYCILESINLDNNQIGDEGARALGCALSQKVIRNEPSSRLRALYLGYNEIGDEGATFIGQALETAGCGIRHVELQYNKIGDKGAIALSDALQSSNNTSISLNLAGNNITIVGVKALAAAVIVGRLHGRRINIIGINNFKQLVEQMAGAFSQKCAQIFTFWKKAPVTVHSLIGSYLLGDSEEQAKTDNAPTSLQSVQKPLIRQSEQSLSCTESIPSSSLSSSASSSNANPALLSLASLASLRSILLPPNSSLIAPHSSIFSPTSSSASSTIDLLQELRQEFRKPLQQQGKDEKESSSDILMPSSLSSSTSP